MSVPKIAAILPVYNGEQYLSQAISSVLSQDTNEWLLYIINDGSTDRTQSIIQEWKERYPEKIIVFNNEKNIGYAASCNIGFHNSRSHPYVLTVNADDIQAPNRFSLLLKRIESTGVDLVIHDCEIIDKEGRKTGRTKGFDTNRITCKNVFAEQMRRNHFWNGLVLFKNSDNIFVDSELRISEDYDLFIRLFYEDAIFSYVDEKLLLYRVHEENMSRDYQKAEEACKIIFDKYDLYDLENKIVFAYPFEGEKYISLAQVCIYRKEWKRALGYLNKGMEIINQPEEIKIELSFMKGYVYYLLGSYSNSEKAYQYGYEHKVINPALLNNLAVVRHLLGKDQKEIVYLLEKALQIEPLYGDAKQNIEILLYGVEKSLKMTPRLLRTKLIRYS